MVGSIISSVIGAGAASDAADAQTAAAGQANALQKYMYDTTREDQAPWRKAGGGAVNYIAQLLGIPGYGDSGGSSKTLKAPNLEDYARSLGRGERWEYVNPGANDSGVGPQAGYYPTGGGGGNGGYDYEAYNKDLEAYNKAIDASGGSAEPIDLTEKLRATPGYQFQQEEGLQALERGAAASGRLNSGATMKGITKYSQGLADSTYENYMNRLYSLAGLGQTSVQATGQAGQNYANQAGANLINAGNAQASGYINAANAWTGGMNSISNNLAYLGMKSGSGGLTGDQINYVKSYFDW